MTRAMRVVLPPSGFWGHRRLLKSRLTRQMHDDLAQFSKKAPTFEVKRYVRA